MKTIVININGEEKQIEARFDLSDIIQQIKNFGAQPGFTLYLDGKEIRGPNDYIEMFTTSGNRYMQGELKYKNNARQGNNQFNYNPPKEDFDNIIPLRQENYGDDDQLVSIKFNPNAFVKPNNPPNQPSNSFEPVPMRQEETEMYSVKFNNPNAFVKRNNPPNQPSNSFVPIPMRQEEQDIFSVKFNNQNVFVKQPSNDDIYDPMKNKEKFTVQYDKQIILPENPGNKFRKQITITNNTREEFTEKEKLFLRSINENGDKKLYFGNVKLSPFKPGETKKLAVDFNLKPIKNDGNKAYFAIFHDLKKISQSYEITFYEFGVSPSISFPQVDKKHPVDAVLVDDTPDNPFGEDINDVPYVPEQKNEERFNENPIYKNNAVEYKGTSKLPRNIIKALNNNSEIPIVCHVSYKYDNQDIQKIKGDLQKSGIQPNKISDREIENELKSNKNYGRTLYQLKKKLLKKI